MEPEVHDIPTEVLTAAADRLRDVISGAVAPGPWRTDLSDVYGQTATAWIATGNNRGTAAYIAAMSPAVGEALETLLRRMATFYVGTASGWPRGTEPLQSLVHTILGRVPAAPDGTTTVDVRPTRYEVTCLPLYHPDYDAYRVVVEDCGSGIWVIRHDRFCLAHNGEWEVEPAVDSNGWLGGHGYDRDDALRLAKAAAPNVVVDGRTAAAVARLAVFHRGDYATSVSGTPDPGRDEAEGIHPYLSTACFHGQHDQCGRAQHDRGERGLPHCKFCTAVCSCPVCRHGEGMDR